MKLIRSDAEVVKKKRIAKEPLPTLLSNLP
jgi:hypothetical protein